MLSRLKSNLQTSRTWAQKYEVPNALETIKRQTSKYRLAQSSPSDVYRQTRLLLDLERNPSVPTGTYEDAKTVAERLRPARELFGNGTIAWDKLDTSALAPSDWHLLAEVYERLGDWALADRLYKEALFSSLQLPPRSVQRVSLVLDYVYFLVQHDVDLERAEEVCTMLLDEVEPSILKHRNWDAVTVYKGTGEYEFLDYNNGWTEAGEYILEILEALSLVLNYRGRFTEARSILAIIDHLSRVVPLHTDISIRVVFSRALSQWGLEMRESSNLEFCRAWILSATLLGNWHSRTLWILHSFAIALLSWGREAEASSLLTECYLGRHYRFGPAHPLTVATYRVLQRCTLKQPQREIIHFFRTSSSASRLKSTAYEHMELWTIADTLQWTDGNCYGLADNIIGALLESANLLPENTTAFHYLSITKIRLERAMAGCKARLGAPEEGVARLEWLLQKESRMNKMLRLCLKLDMAIILSIRREPDTIRKIQELSETVFFEAKGTLEKAARDSFAIAKAFHMRLMQHDLTHFEFATDGDGRPSPFTTIERIGHGGFAAVESVEVKGAVYARKVMILKKHNERMLRELVENEVAIMKALDDHHHIVKIFCTYQEKRQFSIVLEPLATADLESYLYQPNAYPLDLSPTIERWMRCLADTLAFLHRRGVRHKDVKTKNILVKGDQVYFSDFGSSRSFNYESASSTEGPAFGNTRMYSAPEVIAQQRRNESSDVFALGCVFAEMVTVLCGIPLEAFKTFRYISDPESENYRSHAFFATLDLVDEWFSSSGNHIPIWGTDMYDAFIKPMLAIEPKDRPSARRLTKDMARYFRSQNFDIETACPLCQAYAEESVFEVQDSKALMRVKGKVKWMDRVRGFGYLETERFSSILLRYDGILHRRGLEFLKPGQAVEFRIGQRLEGPEAYDLMIVQSDPHEQGQSKVTSTAVRPSEVYSMINAAKNGVDTPLASPTSPTLRSPKTLPSIANSSAPREALPSQPKQRSLSSARFSPPAEYFPPYYEADRRYTNSSPSRPKQRSLSSVRFSPPLVETITSYEDISLDKGPSPVLTKVFSDPIPIRTSAVAMGA